LRAPSAAGAAGLFFSQDPSALELTVRAKGYFDP
jgi:hypothetical protein